MKARARGFGLVEIMLALVLGLILSLALAQVFISSKNTWLSQGSSARLQEDARFVLSKLVREVRLVGMFGCLATVSDEGPGGLFTKALQTPVQWDARQQSLTLISAAVEADWSWHNWVIHTDCLTSAQAWSRGRTPSLAQGEFALPIHRQVYRFNANRSELTLDGQPLISNVKRFSVLFGVADAVGQTAVARYTAQPDPALIRSVRLSLTLFDPADRAQEQRFDVVAAIRNRLE